MLSVLFALLQWRWVEEAQSLSVGGVGEEEGRVDGGYDECGEQCGGAQGREGEL